MSTSEFQDNQLVGMHRRFIRLRDDWLEDKRNSDVYLGNAIGADPGLIARVASAKDNSSYFPTIMRPRCTFIVEQGIEFLTRDEELERLAEAVQHAGGKLSVEDDPGDAKYSWSEAYKLQKLLIAQWALTPAPPYFGAAYRAFVSTTLHTSGLLQRRLAHDLLGGIAAFPDRRSDDAAGSLHFISQESARRVAKECDALLALCLADSNERLDDRRRKQAQSYAGFNQFFLAQRLKNGRLASVGWKLFLDAVADPTPVSQRCGIAENAAAIINFVRKEHPRKANIMEAQFQEARLNSQKT